MRIALVAPFGLRAKGTGRARALPLGEALVCRGHQVGLFVPPYDSPEDSARRWQQNGVAVINVALPGHGPRRALGRWYGSPLWHMLLAWRLLRTVRAWHPDVVHVFKPKGPSGLVGAAWWLWGGRAFGRSPVVVDSDDWEGPGGWNDDPRAGYSALQRRVFAWQERFGLSHAACWTVASRCLEARAIRFGADAERVLILPNGVTDAGLQMGDRPPSRPPLGLEDGATAVHSAILYTRFAGVRVADVAAIWQRVVAALPTARLAVVGQGLAREQAELERAAPNVDVLGWVEPASLHALCERAGVALVPWADTPSNQARHSAKVLELMSAGVPIVAYAVGELPVTLADGGVLIPPGDPSAFAQAVIELLNDPGRAGRLGATAQARVKSEYAWGRLAEVALEAYAMARGLSGER